MRDDRHERVDIISTTNKETIDVAYVILVGEDGAADVLEAAWQQGSKRLRTHTKTDGALVVYDTNLAREFVRDVKKRITDGKLVVFRCENPHDVVEAGGTT